MSLSRNFEAKISGLLDLTDNLIDGEVVPPENVVRYDEDDPYLVVAADKGTATFSDIANEIAEDYGFWLGDAFASGLIYGLFVWVNLEKIQYFNSTLMPQDIQYADQLMMVWPS